MRLFTALLLLCCIRAAAQPALIPEPKELSWGKGRLQLGNRLSVQSADFPKEAARLRQLLNKQQLPAAASKPPSFTIRKKPMGKEAYRLEVSAGGILLEASTAQGAFYGIQTFMQLLREGAVPFCRISDEPAFSWRGYMVDVGRNYQSMALLKEQIGVMAKYKYNIFHFHLTEDIAWRLAVKQYPQLTAPEHMIRNKGKFYSEADMRELIKFCADRHILLVPEIDMPGHSAAFKRAMGTDMQSDSGVAIVKNILREFCDTYQLPYIHIGGDEVRIKNKNFLPEIIDQLHSAGKLTIGWSPGGNVSAQTIRQLWGDSGVTDTSLSYIDSRYFYINHMDPLESVVSVYFRQVGGRLKEDRNMKGGTLCLWHDRNVRSEEDMMRMNPVYPALLAFSEKVWKGGGVEGFQVKITDTAAFAGFERRLVEHGKEYFRQKPFPYAAQSSIKWQLYGPFNNGGDLSRSFAPENGDLPQPAMEATGGTIILRHWWPLVRSWLPHPEKNSTWYATTRIWSDTDTTAGFWIGFYNLSRSPATDSPPEGAWDKKESRVWVNGTPVTPPHWRHGGQKGRLETPLEDEGYEYRAPTPVKLRKGWNTVLVKAPVGSFESPDWNNPVKWMFTFVPAPVDE